MQSSLDGTGWKERFLAAFKPLFPSREWPEGKLDELFQYLHFREMKEGDVLLREGQTCTSVPFVIEGSIRVFKSAASGREITLYRIESGQSCILSLGCASDLPGFPASVVVEVPSSAAFFPTEIVKRLFSESPTFRDFALGQYSRRLAEVVELVEEVAFQKVDTRLAQWLANQTARAAAITATHQELADHVGTSREVVSRILKDWEARSYLELSRGAIRLLPGFSALLDSLNVR